MPEILIIGGPNGAGKTTAARSLFRERIGMREFVNADEIARGLSPFHPEGAAIAAGRLMLERMNELVERGESFVVETTCSGRSNLNFVRQRRAEGWAIGLLYLWLRSPAVAVRRVARRVREGGHSVPRDAIIRRYWSGLSKCSAALFTSGGLSEYPRQYGRKSCSDCREDRRLPSRRL